MKIALYIEDGLEQIVLTPDNATEKGILDKIHDASREISLQRGAFYGCRGGWTRWKERYVSSFSIGQQDQDESTMIVLKVRPKSDVPETQPGEMQNTSE